jgi:hypothetical protein
MIWVSWITVSASAEVKNPWGKWFEHLLKKSPANGLGVLNGNFSGFD